MSKINFNYLLILFFDLIWFVCSYILILSLTDYLSKIEYMPYVIFGYGSAYLSLKLNQKERKKKRKQITYSIISIVLAILALFIILNFYHIEYSVLYKNIIYFIIPFLIFMIAEYMYYSNKYVDI